MATKERHKVIIVGAHTHAGVSRYAKDYGISESDAKLELIQYALNRIATLARYDAKRGEKKKGKARDKKAAR